ncbi:unnamed protein product [Coffea canephora]|uniref:Uncharacterized protein n=1 Tax=Coffea canephora TaxID=49390 RepID=A0A068U2K0_COFCA|nr:unnamed protein product [Coffea canephora]
MNNTTLLSSPLFTKRKTHWKEKVKTKKKIKIKTTKLETYRKIGTKIETFFFLIISYIQSVVTK